MSDASTGTNSKTTNLAIDNDVYEELRLRSDAEQRAIRTVGMNAIRKGLGPRKKWRSLQRSSVSHN